jgi:hypothetical protein
MRLLQGSSNSSSNSSSNTTNSTIEDDLSDNSTEEAETEDEEEARKIDKIDIRTKTILICSTIGGLFCILFGFLSVKMLFS